MKGGGSGGGGESYVTSGKPSRYRRYLAISVTILRRTDQPGAPTVANNLEDQKWETFWVFDDLRSKQELPEMAVVDFQFIPVSGDANLSGFINEINGLDYKVERYDDGITVQISTRPIALSAERIWFHEKLFTVIGQKYGFSPDGWGFLGVERDGVSSN